MKAIYSSLSDARLCCIACLILKSFIQRFLLAVLLSNSNHLILVFVTTVLQTVYFIEITWTVVTTYERLNLVF